MQHRFKSLSPELYAKLAIVAREAALQMDSRLELVALQPQLILDVGWDVSESSQLLKRRYPQAQMLNVNPTQDYAIDLIFANLILPWCESLPEILQEWCRMLKPNGLLMLTTLGLDTLQELHDRVDPALLPTLMDMHNLGDALLHAGFLDPVMDVEYLTLTYRTAEQLFHELQVTGMLATSAELNNIQLEKNKSNLFSATYELIYGHTWGPGKAQGFKADVSGTVTIPVDFLRKS